MYNDGSAENSYSNPVLRQATIDYGGRRAALTAFGGLHYIRGNTAPYFTLTGEVYIAGRHDIEEGGCLHERLIDEWPELGPLAEIHGASMDGAPMYAEENGWFWLAGYLGVVTTYIRDSDDCLGAFARHIRVTRDEASRIASSIVLACVEGLDNAEALREEWGQRCESMRPRWATEAQNLVDAYGLHVFGDKYEED